MPMPVTLPLPAGLIDTLKVVTPVPLMDRLSVGMSTALEGIESEAVFVPREVGKKRISREQFPDGTIVLPEQLSFIKLNSPWAAPESEIIPITKSALPLLNRAAVFVDGVLRLVLPKSRKAGEAEICGLGIKARA